MGVGDQSRNVGIPNQPLTSSAKPAPTARVPDGTATPASAPARAPSEVKKNLQHSPVPELPEKNFRIVFRRRGGLNLRDVNGSVLLLLTRTASLLFYARWFIRLYLQFL